MEAERALPRQDMAEARWALLLGNFVIGCGVMVVGGTLNDITHSLDISVQQGGHMIAIAALMMGLGAPILAGLVGSGDRRRLLTAAMLWYALGHALCALAPNYTWLWPLRALTVLSAAVFTPQAAAVVGYMSTPAHRGRAITFVFMGWSIASVAGLPLAAWVGERMGWRVAMGAIAVGSLVAAWAVHRSVPTGIRPPALSMRSWRKVFSSPLMMGLVAVTALQSTGQFTVLAYAAPYYKIGFGASPEQISFLFAWFGALALAGNLLLNKYVDRVGAARAVTSTLGLMALSLLIWPLAHDVATLALVLLPWALSGFAANSGQQARLGGLSPRLTPALMSLNTSAIYLGHALGASGGGLVLSHAGYGQLHWLGLFWMLLAWAVSWWAWRAQQAQEKRRDELLSVSPPANA
ncbi:MFS transporter [Aquabacterium sp. CECT 9606]|uniref:MFS transporter n=1 Tax=Aquabacterium sp. CECT 9606 TaxID=2845822 RepID=UPI001E57D2A8|nr:MFS transporter [Aquabacterium sp. CECT 9606]CAH0352924.1 Purine efflux pump PbuE [Aquabacterium sp. CECT 9606]